MSWGENGFNITTDQTDIIPDSYVPDLQMRVISTDNRDDDDDDDDGPPDDHFEPDMAIYHEFLAPDESGYRWLW